MLNTPNQTQVAAAPVGRMNSVGTGQKDDGRAKVMQIQLKEVAIVASALLVTAGLVGGYWLYTQQEERYGGGTVIFSKDAKPVTLNAHPAVNAPPASTTIAGLVSVTKTTDSIHADIYFDFDRSRLSADGVAILQEKAEVLKKDGSWAVLVQGYADQHGPAVYNKTLAGRRAEAVKQFLVELGIPGTSIKVVTLGKEGAICDDQSKECQRLNRRVHLEMIKMGPALVSLPQAPVAKQDQKDSGTGVPKELGTHSNSTANSDSSDQKGVDRINPKPESAGSHSH
jgi:peptidoglycan-associated lipoprotein